MTKAEIDRKYRLAHPERVAARKRLWRKNNPEKTASAARRWYKANPEKVKAAVARRRVRDLKRLYGITIEEYNQILAVQGGVCAVCKRPPKVKKDNTPKWGAKHFAVDHFHGPGKKIRGLLCITCNRQIIGLIESLHINPNVIVDYLSGRSWDSVIPPAVGPDAPEDVG